jgi:hypothetical protein
MCQKICYGAQYIYGIPLEGIACVMSLYKHEEYPSNSMDQKNSAHDIIV